MTSQFRSILKLVSSVHTFLEGEKEIVRGRYRLTVDCVLYVPLETVNSLLIPVGKRLLCDDFLPSFLSVDPGFEELRGFENH